MQLFDLRFDLWPAVPFSQEVADGGLVKPLLLVEELRHRLGSPLQDAMFHQVADALQEDNVSQEMTSYRRLICCFALINQKHHISHLKVSFYNVLSHSCQACCFSREAECELITSPFWIMSVKLRAPSAARFDSPDDASACLWGTGCGFSAGSSFTASHTQLLHWKNSILPRRLV